MLLVFGPFLLLLEVQSQCSHILRLNTLLSSTIIVFFSLQRIIAWDFFFSFLAWILSAKSFIQKRTRAERLEVGSRQNASLMCPYSFQCRHLQYLLKNISFFSNLDILKQSVIELTI